MQLSTRCLQHLYPPQTAAGISRPKFLAVLSMCGREQSIIVIDVIMQAVYVRGCSCCSLAAVIRQVVLAVLLLHKKILEFRTRRRFIF
jgi:hypothetical protein